MTKTAGTEIVELGNGIYARLHDGLTNSGIIVGDKSVIVIDSLRVPSFARDLIQDIRHITSKPTQYVIDTHSHWDHSWGNEEFPEAIIVGHNNCYQEMVDVEANLHWRTKITQSNDPWSEEAKLVKITPPNLTFESCMRLYFGGHEIQLVYFGKAHTSGDIFIYLPENKIVFTGDVAQDGRVPYLGDSYPSDWPNTDDLLIELPVNRFVSGHGPIGSYETLVESRDFIHQLVEYTKFGLLESMNVDMLTTYVINKLAPQFGGWHKFDQLGESIPDICRKLDLRRKRA